MRTSLKVTFIVLSIVLGITSLKGLFLPVATRAQNQDSNSSTSQPLPMNNNAQSQNQGSPTIPSREVRRQRAEKAQSIFKQRPLTQASAEEVGQAAIGYTQLKFNIVNGMPKVVVARPVTIDQLISLGLAGPGENYADKLMLVVLKGNFNVSNLGVGDSQPNDRDQVKYIAYVFDLYAGLPTIVTTGLQGDYFRQVLNEPSLPDLPPPPPELAPKEKLTKKLPYGTVLPGLTKEEIIRRGRPR